jgi:hypothetical protein
MEQLSIRQKLRNLRQGREGLMHAIAAIESMQGHISEHDMELYYLGMINDECELAPLEEHLLGCEACVKRAEASDDYVDAIHVAALCGAQIRQSLIPHTE